MHPFAVDLHRAQAGEQLDEMPDEVPVGIEELAPFTVALPGLDFLFEHGQVFPHRVAGDAQRTRYASNGHPGAFIVQRLDFVYHVPPRQGCLLLPVCMSGKRRKETAERLPFQLRGGSKLLTLCGSIYLAH